MTKVYSDEVYRARLEPVEGSEQGKTRPVVVLQNPDLGRFTSTAMCIPLTTNLNRHPPDRHGKKVRPVSEAHGGSPHPPGRTFLIEIALEVHDLI